MYTLQKRLLNAIVDDDKELVFQLLTQNIDLNICLPDDTFSILEHSLIRLYEKTGSIEIVYELLKYGADVNFSCCNHLFPLNAGLWFSTTRPQLVDILLKYGANPNTKEELSTLVTVDDEISTSKLLLDYGAQYNQDIPNGYATNNALHRAIRNSNTKMIKLLLDYGADIMSDEEGYMLNTSEYEEFEKLLNPNNPPYLKLGENKEDKYIIYENELIEKEGYLPYSKPYLLANKQNQKDKKYLYADNKIDAFVYWCYSKNLMIDAVQKAISNVYKKETTLEYTQLDTFIVNFIDAKLTTDYFTEAGKAFATSYLTVTHWWYNLHTDFNRLYQEEGIKLPRAIESQDEFETLLKLLDIRYEQFVSGKDFNSNQNKEELEALIEGREPRPRYIQMAGKL